MTNKLHILLAGCLVAASLALPAQAQESPSPSPDIQAVAGPSIKAIVKKEILFDSSNSKIPDPNQVQEILWDFGDGTKTTGQSVAHAYARPGSYLVHLKITAGGKAYEDTTQAQIFNRVMILVADGTITEDQLSLAQKQASEEKTWLYPLTVSGGIPEALAEEELTKQLVNARDDVAEAKVIVTWTSGSIGVSVLSKLAQYINQAGVSFFQNLDMPNKGIIVLSDTPFGVMAPTAQAMFDQLRPAYVLLARPSALPLIYSAQTAEDARTNIVNVQADHRLLGTFSSRTISEINFINFFSFGLNYLVNHGVPINNIVLILMIPVIATILSFARQVIGFKAFGLITPAMTTLSFLVMGLYTGLVVFVVVLLSGTLTRMLLRKLRLLYLPRMALVLTNASLAILVMLGIGAATGRTATLSFSIFPILILTILAEDFIAVQFSRGIRTALRTTAWTLVLVIACYYIVSWQLLRSFLLSYPETILLAIPINILLGRFSGLRVVEYIRFRQLLRYGTPPEQPL